MLPAHPQDDGPAALPPPADPRDASAAITLDPAAGSQFVRAVFGMDGKGGHVTPVGGHGSHLMGDLAAANALIVVPEDDEALDAGARVQVLVLDRDF